MHTLPLLTFLLVTTAPRIASGQFFWQFNQSCGPFELSTPDGLLQRMPNGTITLEGLSNGTAASNNSRAFYIHDNGVLSWDPDTEYRTCGFYDFYIPSIYMNCYPNHMLSPNSDMTFSIDEAGRLKYRDNATFHLCRSDLLGEPAIDLGNDMGNEKEGEFLLLPGNIDEQHRENRTVSNCDRTLEIQASSCHGFLAVEEADDHGSGSDPTDGEEGGASDSSGAARHGVQATLAFLMVFWAV